jgi:hypothetical protein
MEISEKIFDFSLAYLILGKYYHAKSKKETWI